jgi:NADH-quinone oxidoreductase subunit G
MPDGVVWLPTNARDCRTRATLGAGHGATVSLTRSDAPPVVGADPAAAAGGGQ